MRRLTPALLVLALAGCGAAPAALHEVSPAQAPAEATGWPVAIPWDAPLGPAPRVTLDTARTVGGLSFDPPRPAWGAPYVVQVRDAATTDPSSRSFAMTYDLTGRIGPGRDGRVLVQARPTTQTVAHLEHMAATNEPDEDFTMIDLAGVPALLITGSGLGRVVLVDGGVLYSLTGPGLSPELARELAVEAFRS